MKISKRIYVAGISGIVAMCLIGMYGWSLRQEVARAHASAIAPYGDKVQEIYRAKTDIPTGTQLTADLVEKVTWPSALLPGNVALSESDFEGKTAKSLIKQNEPLSLDRISDTKSGLQIPQGLTALTVPSDDTLGVGGALVSGSRVDVYSVIEGAAHLLDQSVLVVETSSYLGEAEKKSTRPPLSWVTLAVKAESVEEMLAASKSGTLYLTLPSLERALESGGASGAAATGSSLEMTSSATISPPATIPETTSPDTTPFVPLGGEAQ